MKSFMIPCLGYDVAADLYEGSDPDQILLNLIGWTSAKLRHQETLEAINAQTGMSVLTFDYSGHGDSTVDPFELRPAQHLLEAITVFDWIANTYPEKSISIMGSSYGGFMAAQIAAYRNFQSLILCAPAIYTPHDLYTLNSAIDREEIGGRYRRDSEVLAAHPLFVNPRIFDGSALVVAHELDTVVPTQTTNAYAAGLDAKLVTVKSIPHSVREASHEDRAKYQKVIADWLLEN